MPNIPASQREREREESIRKMAEEYRTVFTRSFTMPVSLEEWTRAGQALKHDIMYLETHEELRPFYDVALEHNPIVQSIYCRKLRYIRQQTTIAIDEQITKLRSRAGLPPLSEYFYGGAKDGLGSPLIYDMLGAKLMVTNPFTGITTEKDVEPAVILYQVPDNVPERLRRNSANPNQRLSIWASYRDEWIMREAEKRRARRQARAMHEEVRKLKLKLLHQHERMETKMIKLQTKEHHYRDEKAITTAQGQGAALQPAQGGTHAWQRRLPRHRCHLTQAGDDGGPWLWRG